MVGILVVSYLIVPILSGYLYEKEKHDNKYRWSDCCKKANGCCAYGVNCSCYMCNLRTKYILLTIAYPLLAYKIPVLLSQYGRNLYIKRLERLRELETVESDVKKILDKNED